MRWWYLLWSPPPRYRCFFCVLPNGPVVKDRQPVTYAIPSRLPQPASSTKAHRSAVKEDELSQYSTCGSYAAGAHSFLAPPTESRLSSDSRCDASPGKRGVLTR